MQTRSKTLLAALAAATLFSGCAMHHAGGAGKGGHGSGERRDMARMCEMHREMMAGKTPEEQRAAVEAHVRSRHGTASAERVSHHQKMMEAHCPGAGSKP